MDAKARINIGLFDLGGKNRVPTEADNHNFHQKTTGTPYDISVTELDNLFLYFTESKVTGDYIVGTVADFWKSESWQFSENFSISTYIELLIPRSRSSDV
ncbi:ISAzo13-like element transposase-related protein [Nostoc sp.]